jgi:hypothetical protein
MSPHASPHLRALGAALPAGLQRFHAAAERRTVSGQARVTTGGVFARVLLGLFGLHLRDGEQPLDVTFMPDGSGTIWDRRFGQAALSAGLRQAASAFSSKPLVPLPCDFG